MIYLNQKFNIIKIDDVDVFGPVVEISKNELMVTSRWNFFVDQDFSENVEVDHYGTGGIFKKLFSKDELLQYWSDNNPQK